ncbi:MAG: preprotein translocase subunit SecE [Candidatus Paralactobacillus gallistercoris]|uniref:Protein translocase subunit SecE n=1 Tax=Candidatus Paralactobacillus gallistercoris TaxID=2838724 RepID=A0A948TJY7_9LACO|nr:preprotein translocase subunit SecE [Candidatus Paralactobacillus gallistercoris]
MRFIKSVFAEMKLVTWPTAKETRHDTWVVIVTSLLFAIFFALTDWILQGILHLIVG